MHLFRDYFVELLGDVLSSSKLLPHEFSEEVVPAVQSEYEQALNQPQVLGLDKLSQTAYRQRGLGASLFSDPASPVSHSDVVKFAQAVFAKDNIAVVGSGIDESHLSKLVGKHFANVRSNKGPIQAGSKQYFGGDARVSFVPHEGAEGPHAHFGHYFVAFEGAGVDASPELSVLRSHLGGESSVKWTTGLSPLAQLKDKVAGAEATAFNLAFTDSGLFGAYITAPHAKLLDAAKEVAKVLKDASSSISAEDLTKAKAKARFEAAAAIENRAGIHAAVGGQVSLCQPLWRIYLADVSFHRQLLEAKVQALDETLAKIEGVSASNLSSVRLYPPFLPTALCES